MLRSHYRQLRALLVIALVAIVAASVALVIVANDEESTSTTATPVHSIEYGNFNPQTGRPMANDATPDESKIAAAISSAQQSEAGGLDESRVAAAIGSSTASPTGEPSDRHPGARP